MLRFTLLLLISLFGINTHAADLKQSKSNFIEGKHYQALEAPLINMGAPVVEFMYYGCRACFQLVPAVAEWSHTKKIDVLLVPVHSESAMVEEARLFHTFDVMGVLGKMYEEGFIIVQTDKSKLQGTDRVNSFLDKNGVDKEKFWTVWKSQEVNQRLAGSAALTRQAKIIKTPTFVVHGTYKVDVESLGSVEELFELLNYLVAMQPKSAPVLLKKPG
ncbi:DsbA family protein [Cellvibrio mixtus]|uniref:DsbA family protein n=1 Tax=Cellvibrio mixtus TaxID=39650 RepID=UPI000586D06A|nr:DsbA family protein [Cellvibrio mixtus]